MGFLVGIINGITVAFQNSQFKKLKGVDSHILNWSRFLVGTLVVAILVPVFSHWVMPPRQFWFILILGSIPVEVMVSHFYVRAFQVSPNRLLVRSFLCL